MTDCGYQLGDSWHDVAGKCKSKVPDVFLGVVHCEGKVLDLTE